MLAKDGEIYPCDIWVRMRLVGELNRDVFTECWDEMLRRHPLLICRLEKRSTGHRWVKSNQMPPIEWSVRSNVFAGDSNNQPIWPDPKPFDLEDGRLVFPTMVEYYAGGFDFFLQIHHALCDGLGILDALEDLWTLYDVAINGTSHKRLDRFLDIDCEQRLVSRNRFGLNLSKLFRLIPKQIVGLKGVRQFLMRSPVALVDHNLPRESPNQVSSIEACLSESSFRSIRAYAQQNRVTVNECIAAAIFDAVNDFRNDRRESRPSDWIRMMIPMDMRSSDDKKGLTACNVVSSVFLDRQPTQVSDFKGLLNSINQEMHLIKENKLAFMFLLSIWLRKLTHIGRHGSALAKRCETTMVFTNLGRIFPRTKLTKGADGIRCGNLVLNDFSILAPLNPFTILAVSYCEFASIPKIQLRYCDRVMMTDDAKAIMDKIVRRLQQFHQ